MKPRPAPQLEATAPTGGGGQAAEVTTRHEFCAAHRLRSPHLSEAENAALFGTCASEHGHTYRLEVTVRGPIDPRTGMVVDLLRLREHVDAWLAANLDHRHLDRDVPFLAGQLTTLENLCRAIFRELGPQLGGGRGPRLCRVTMAESTAAHVAVTGD